MLPVCPPIDSGLFGVDLPKASLPVVQTKVEKLWNESGLSKYAKVPSVQDLANTPSSQRSLPGESTPAVQEGDAELPENSDLSEFAGVPTLQSANSADARRPHPGGVSTTGGDKKGTPVVSQHSGPRTSTEGTGVGSDESLRVSEPRRPPKGMLLVKKDDLGSLPENEFDLYVVAVVKTDALPDIDDRNWTNSWLDVQVHRDKCLLQMTRSENGIQTEFTPWTPSQWRQKSNKDHDITLPYVKAQKISKAVESAKTIEVILLETK